jgi:two-component system alkaline phosphatase synthesis response regulator PhoP
MNTILIVEDEKAISNLIKISLTTSGYKCDTAYDGVQAADMIEVKRYDMILLDIMLPKIDGYEIMEYVKPLDIPVIFLTAKGKLEDKVKGLKMGADDYIVKPFEIAELLARVETVLRRYYKRETMIQIDSITIDTASMIVKKNGIEVAFTQKEFKLLLLFIENPNVALFRERIYEYVWEGEYEGDTRTVDLHVQRIRKKLGWEDKIVSVYKVGYRLEV